MTSDHGAATSDHGAATSDHGAATSDAGTAPVAGRGVRVWFGALAGVGLGALTAPVDVVAAAVPATRPRMARAELRRITRFHGPVDVAVVEPGRCARYLLARAALGLLGGGVVVLLVLGVAVAVSMVTAWIFDGGWGLISDDGGVGTGLIALATPPGLLLLFLVVVGVLGVGALDRWLAETVLGSARELRRRVTELTTVRDDVVDAVDDERRRIERDLHDGVQQRLVALGMLLGRARRAEEPDRARALLDDAAEVSRDAVRELREVADRIYPAALADGLPAALDRLREQAGIRVDLDCRIRRDLRPATATAAYFAITEAVTNAVKHSGADSVRIVATDDAGHLEASVTDHGCGGADPRGGGLSGIARRVAALDGTLTVDSPPGGPTRVQVSVPCA